SRGGTRWFKMTGMQKRLVILVVLVVAVAGLLYWKADQSFRDHAGLPGMESSRPASLTLDDILGRDLRRVDVSDERVTTTQVPVVEATTAEIPDAENDEAPAASTAPVEMTKAVTAPPLESTPAVGASETTRSGEPWPQLPFAWMSPT